ncbi:hypothetical protein HF086_006570 [Spodoptera exigua]|uniref:Uncharacterized protein n=1 Tax=Spodoptera exigua TaxID=7107 RepID=A0A922MS17_SPOEX|nr:hypothetical protein HF086_006570 [Spodoptera exigua]
MFNISNIYKSSCVTSCLVLQARYKTKIHWSKLKKKTGPKYKALNHFDEFYASVFGDAKWQAMREAMLRRSKYVALVNNYGDADKTMEELTNRGAHCLKKLITIQQEYNKEYNIISEPTQVVETEKQSERLTDYMERQQTDEISSIYPNSENKPEKLDMEDDEEVKVKKVNQEMTFPTKTLDESIAEAKIDESRIIDPSMEEKDFPFIIEPDGPLKYPEHLKVFTYEMDSDQTTFPEPKRCQTVLALDLSPGDRVLDLAQPLGAKP